MCVADLLFLGSLARARVRRWSRCAVRRLLQLQQPFVPPRIYFAVTAVAHFNRRRCDIEFLDPLSVGHISVDDRSLPSAADFTAPLALGLSREHPEKVAMPGVARPAEICRQGSPYTGPTIRSEKDSSTFRSRSSVHARDVGSNAEQRFGPTLSCGATTRSGCSITQAVILSHTQPCCSGAQLNTLDKAFPNHRPIVLVGHSMGGILSRLMITDSCGDKVWRYFFGTLPSQTKLSSESKALLREALIFKPQPDVGRVIFISTPHRGSMIAQGPIGRIASSMIRKSAEFVRLGPEILQASVVQEDPGVMKLNRMPNSIDTLSPNDPFVKIINTLPLEKSVPYHSIIGDRGRGDTPNSSDGVVPYWSSHVGGAKSEKIVPSDHGANQNPEGIAEVIRILKEHTENKGPLKKTRPTIPGQGDPLAIRRIPERNELSTTKK